MSRRPPSTLRVVPWAAPEPFLFFTDDEPVLGRRVTEGRRRELRAGDQEHDQAKHELPHGSPSALLTPRRPRR